MKKISQKNRPGTKGYVIGVDGGGTKTKVALADSWGKVLSTASSGPSNLRNLGIERSVFNIRQGIKKVLRQRGANQIFSVAIALAAVEEEYSKEKGKIKEGLLKFFPSFEGKIFIFSDQIVAFKAGTEKKEGIVLISGTGAVCHGWWGGKEAKVSGWGWLNDEGSGFWIGQRALCAVLKELDGRGPKTKITKLVFEAWKIKGKEGLLRKVYQEDFVRKISSVSAFVDGAYKAGDEMAKNILKEAALELSLSAISVIKQLKMEKERFPVVFVGKVFDSEIVAEGVKKEVKKVASKAEFVVAKEPVRGAVRLALEKI